MTKAEVVSHIAGSADVTKVQAEKMLETFVSIVVNETLGAGNSLTVTGLGTFKQQKSAARVGRNPSNGQAINIPASVKIAFKMSSSLK